MLKRFLEVLHATLTGRRLSEAVKRNADAADRLDAAVREVLGK